MSKQLLFLCLFYVLSSYNAKGQGMEPFIKGGLTIGLFDGPAASGDDVGHIGMNLGAGTGKAGFITSMYILMVPIIGMFFRQKIKWNVWVAVGIALVGLYFLCVNGKIEFVPADICLMLGALGFAGQIVTIDRYGHRVDALRLSGMQFLLGGFLTSIIAVIYEILPFPGGIFVFVVPHSSVLPCREISFCIISLKNFIFKAI